MLMWSFILENVLPVIQTLMTSAVAMAAIKIAFQAGEVLQHVKDIDARVVRLESLRLEALRASGD